MHGHPTPPGMLGSVSSMYNHDTTQTTISARYTARLNASCEKNREEQKARQRQLELGVSRGAFADRDAYEELTGSSEEENMIGNVTSPSCAEKHAGAGRELGTKAVCCRRQPIARPATLRGQDEGQRVPPAWQWRQPRPGGSPPWGAHDSDKHIGPGRGDLLPVNGAVKCVHSGSQRAGRPVSPLP